MGLFDIFLSMDRKIQKHQRKVTNRDVQPEDREVSVRWLADNGSGKALTALLTRFDMKLDNHLNDKDEKDFTYGLLVSKGDAMVRPLKHHLKRCRQFALPIRMFEELQGELEAISLVYDLLRIEVEKDNFKPEKKTNMLVWLAERTHPGAIEAAAPLLKDFDEGVRCAATEVMIAQKDDEARAPLLAAFLDPDDDSRRLRVRIAEVFAQRRWTVDDPDAVAALLPEGFTVRDGLVIAS